VLGCKLILNGNLYFASSIHPYAGAFTITMMIQICFYYFELYDFKVFKSNLELMIRLLQSLGSALIVLASIYCFIPNIMPGRGEFLLALVLIGVTVICWRLLYNEFLKMKYVDQRILILGTGNLAKNIAEKALGDSGFKVIGFTAAEPDRVGESLVNPGIIGTHSEIDRLCDRYKVNRVIVANEER
jgi:FlaA1/EpsC-like NDP-sugar epimerase